MEKKNMKFHACRNCHLVNWSSKLSSISENWKCWIIFDEIGIKFYENISAVLELLEFLIADGRTRSGTHEQWRNRHFTRTLGKHALTVCCNLTFAYLRCYQDVCCVWRRHQYPRHPSWGGGREQQQQQQQQQQHACSCAQLSTKPGWLISEWR